MKLLDAVTKPSVLTGFGYNQASTMNRLTSSRYLSPTQTAAWLALLVLLLSAGCSRFNCTRLEQLAGADTDLIAFSYSIAEELVATARPPLIPRNPEMPILVTTFVDNNNLARTSQFGRTLQEHIGSRLVQLGYAVKEIKLASQLTIEPRSGESMLTREIDRISPSIKSQAILVGTINITSRTMYISARLIEPVRHTILASTDHRLCMDDTVLAMFGLKRQMPTATGNDEIKEPSRPFMNSILY